MAAPTQDQQSPALAELQEIARTREPDRYVAALFAPKPVQGALIAIAAFAAELARIPAVASEPMIGEIRLQWWRDAIGDGVRGTATGHPVADAFAAVVRQHTLSLEAVHQLIDARSFDLSGDVHADVAALERHLASVEGTPFALGWQVLSGQALAAETAGSAGVAYGLARDFGRLPALLHNGGFPIPADLLARCGLKREALTAEPRSEETEAAVSSAVRELQSRGREALNAARGQIASGRRDGLAAFLPLAMVEPYFSAQNQRGFLHLEHMQQIVPLSRFWRMGAAWLRKRI